MTLRPAPLLIVAALALSLCACGTETVDKVVYLDRSGCEACHLPVQPDGSFVGIEAAHPEVDGRAPSCVTCHGGDPEARKQSAAHVAPPDGTGRYIRNLTVGELDDVELDYLRFVNPGDLRVAEQSCGRGAGADCHQELVEKVTTNLMSTFAGELGVGRYRAGLQRKGAGVKAVRDVRNPTYRAGQVDGTVGALDAFTEEQVIASETRIGPYQDLWFSKDCMRCHLWSFGDNAFPGDYRSSGCTACHMIYADDGRSRSADPLIDKDGPPHPIEHRLTTAIPSSQCGRCHYEGARIGLSWEGYREPGAAGRDVALPGPLGTARHGHDNTFYVADEDRTNAIDETPPDVHQEAGMHCVDCHGGSDVHGDGNLYTSSAVAVDITCESCHGTPEAEATLRTRSGAPLPQLERDGSGAVWLTGRVDGQRHPVTQIKRSVEAAAADSPLAQSMGRHGGFSHTDSIACHTCHSAWVPTCFGCHVEVDMREVQRSQLSGLATPGRFDTSRGYAATDVLILMLDNRGRIAPSMPAERIFFTAVNGDGETVIDRAVRTGPDGEPGMGHRAIHPHTIQRLSPFQKCDRCHPVEGTFANMETVNQVIGLGSDRFLETDGDGNMWPLDRVIDETYASEVLFGQDDPERARPLPAAVIDRMLSIEVPASP